MSWAEVRSGNKVSIRAAYHTVMAFESAAESTTLCTPQRFATEELENEPYLDAEEPFAIVVGTTRTSLKYLTDKQALLIRAILSEGEITSDSLSEKLGISPGSVSVYVSRLNQRVRELSKGAISPLVSTSRNARGAGSLYKLAVASSQGQAK